MRRYNKYLFLITIFMTVGLNTALSNTALSNTAGSNSALSATAVPKTAVVKSTDLETTGSTELREIEFRVTDHQAGIEDFHKLNVQLQSVAIHPKNAARNSGWLELASDFPFIDIVPLKNGRYVSSGTFQIPFAVYDAVRVKFQSVCGELHNNKPPSLTAKNTTVAARFDLSKKIESDNKLALVLDLYVESLTDHEPNLYQVKVREVRLEK